MRPLGTRCALVVDDSTDSVIALSIMLEGIGWHTEIAFDGIEALRKANSFKPDVVLMDISMPKLDGIYTCGVIRVQPWADHTKVIAITEMSSEEIHERGQFVHFDAILSKPVDFCKLSDLLEDYSR